MGTRSGVDGLLGLVIAHTIDPRHTTAPAGVHLEDAARAAGRQFLDTYAERDGRVVRRDEGGDVVSEGQAYGMLIAVAIGDEARFRAVWSWTKNNLRRPDGLLSWRWFDGKVTDINTAADADLDAARALSLAGRRFKAGELTEDGKRLAAAILTTETAVIGTRTVPPSEPQPISGVAGLGRVLAAGDWARAAPYTVNPGYFSPRAEQDLSAASSDARWADVARTQRVLGWQLIGSGMLPPDWARVDGAGRAIATGPGGAGPPQFGLDAARMPVRLAESCDSADRAMAAAMRPLVNAPGDVPGLRHLDGTPASDWQHPVALVAAAATDRAGGKSDGLAGRLDAAAILQQRYPTYYGSAWVALGRIMLTTSLLGDCDRAA